METLAANINSLPVRGLPRKSLDNPQRSKPACAADAVIAERLDTIVRRLPRLIRPADSRFPLLEALLGADSTAMVARNLVFVAAQVHRDADERRTAEYLLRHRGDIADGTRSALTVLRAARCAAEMDVRRVVSRERPTDFDVLAARASADSIDHADLPSAGDLALSYLTSAIGWTPSPATSELLRDAVAIALDAAERHTLMGGHGPPVLAMRTAARPAARLVTSLRLEFGKDEIARRLARVLVGGDGSPIESSLLWWVAQPDLGESPSEQVRRRWIRDLDAVEDAVYIQQHPRSAG